MKSILTFCILLSALIPMSLYAGQGSVNTGVTVDFEQGYADGVMWKVRSSDNDVERIGCSYKGVVKALRNDHMPWKQRVNQWAWCWAKDANGAEAFCMTQDRNLLDAMQAISPFSYIRFEFTDIDPDTGVGLCTRFDFSIQSLHLPLFTTD